MHTYVNTHTIKDPKALCLPRTHHLNKKLKIISIKSCFVFFFSLSTEPKVFKNIWAMSWLALLFFQMFSPLGSA